MNRIIEDGYGLTLMSKEIQNKTEMWHCWLLQCEDVIAADRLSSGLENVVRAVWKKDPIQQAGAGVCEDRCITVYLRTELGGFVAQCIDAICSSIP